MTVFLLFLGRDRFDIYSEPPEEPLTPPPPYVGRFRRWAHRARVHWHDLVESARRDNPTGRVARRRNQIVCRLAESIAEQRTLWALRDKSMATLLFPATLDEKKARVTLERLLARARRYHGWWLTVDLVLFIGSAVLAPIPGPNALAYYLAFRVVGHLQSWRGARGAAKIAWTFEPDQSLAELASLAEAPRAVRAPRVAAIAERLHLQRLPVYFERVAV
jgi:hypothetical protein